MNEFKGVYSNVFYSLFKWNRLHQFLKSLILVHCLKSKKKIIIKNNWEQYSKYFVFLIANDKMNTHCQTQRNFSLIMLIKSIIANTWFINTWMGIPVKGSTDSPVKTCS